MSVQRPNGRTMGRPGRQEPHASHGSSGRATGRALSARDVPRCARRCGQRPGRARGPVRQIPRRRAAPQDPSPPRPHAERSAWVV